MPLTAGDKLGPYEIISLIGKGGMGEVYSAHDPRTGRDVAIKVSAERFNERFDREVRAVAALNHPNICTLYDVGPNYLVMELVEGPTLAERINEGSISEDEALILARRIADALQAAHEKGIVHRDLKPGNVKITPSGNVKVLDFGLAKMGGIPAAPSEHSPTFTMNETQAGVILGTAGYMSPEQAKGKPVDKRADIFSFGVVLHEMLSGQRVFQGETLSETLASVLKEEPDFNRVPAKSRRLLKACLQKDPNRRLQDIGDAMLLLEESETPVPPSPSRLGTLAWVIAGVSVLAAAGLAFLHFREKAPATELVRFGIPYPEKMTPTTAGSFSVSPDGRKLVFLGAGADGMVRVWLRQLDSTEAHPVPGTETVNVPPPFWSPDSRSFAFASADQKLKRVDTAGGPPQTICDLASAPWGGAWNRDGVIIFGSTRGVMKVSASGGQPSAVTLDNSSRGEAAHRFPSFLPDGKHFLYLTSVTMAAETGGLYAGTIDAQPEQQSAKRILATGYNVVYVPSDDPNTGHVLFLRDGSLMAQVFDAGKLELAGEAVPVADQVSSAPNGYYGRFSASENGVLIYRTGTSSGTQLTWFGRQGAIVGKAGEPGAYGTISSSPDGTKAAATVDDPKTGSTDIWVIDPVRGTNSRLTFDPASSTQPEWSPDGTHIAYISNRGGEWGIYQKAVNGSGSEELLAKTGKTTPTLTHWTQDGRFLIYFSIGEKTGADLWVLPLTGDRKPFPFLRMPFDQIGGRVSPDGRWIAYRSNESGKNELYVQAFTPTPEAGNVAAGGKWMVSKGSEGMARWRKDGKELYYITADGSIMAVDATTVSGFSAGLPRLLFKLPASFFQMATATPGARVDTPDGQRFLVSMPAAENAGPEFSVVLNWQAALKK